MLRWLIKLLKSSKPSLKARRKLIRVPCWNILLCQPEINLWINRAPIQVNQSQRMEDIKIKIRVNNNSRITVSRTFWKCQKNYLINLISMEPKRKMERNLSFSVLTTRKISQLITMNFLLVESWITKMGIRKTKLTS